MRIWPWRIFAVAFLLTGVLGLAVAIVETAVSDRSLHPSLGDFLYGIDIHLLLALCVCLLIRVGAWRAPDRALLSFAFGGFLVVEFGLVGAYWVGTAPFVPDFHTSAGKIATAILVLAGALVGLLLGVMASRYLPWKRWVSWARGPVSAAGIVLALLLVLGNALALWVARPRAATVRIRPDAAHIDRPDVFVILVDTLRRDHLSYFGYGRPTSPHLDRFFRESWLFTDAYTPSTWTMPSVASLFTGLFPSSHGITKAIHQIPGQAPSLAEHFRSYGYKTGAFVGNGTITHGNGFSQGFDVFFPPEPFWWCSRHRTAVERIVKQLRRSGTENRGWRLNAEALHWLQRTSGEPHFLYIHYMEPHSPYVPADRDRQAVAPGISAGPRDPPLFRSFRKQLGETDCNDWECLEDPPQLSAADLEGMVANYDGEVHQVDWRIGKLLEGLDDLGLLAEAHILFCTDHGEEFSDHGGWFHGNSIYEEMIACPLAYRTPGGLSGGGLIRRPVSQLDLVRTLCVRLGMETPPMHQGQEIPELLGGERPRQAVPVLSELPPYLFSLRLRYWKLVRRGPAGSPDWRLFDLSADPREQVDLSSALPDTLALLRGYLEGMVAAFSQTSLEHTAATVDPEVLQRLRDLGYID